MGFAEPRDIRSPTRIALEGNITDLALELTLACALLDTGEVYCSGANVFGELGADWDLDERASFAKVEGIPPIDRVKVGTPGNNACGLADGSLWCWGANGFGAISDDEAEIVHPGKVPGIEDIVDFSLDESFLCVLRSDDAVWCRGWYGANGRCESSYEWGEVNFDHCEKDPYR